LKAISLADLPILGALSALADPVRCRLLWLLERQELTVSELCDVLQLPQSTVSRQLKTLSDAGWVSSRREATSRYYALALDGPEGANTRIWTLMRESLAGTPGVEQDERRLTRVLSGRREASQRFFATASGEWDRLRDGLFGDRFFLPALTGLLPSEWTIADLGCGTGVITAALAPWVRQVIGVDASDEMLAAAAARVNDLPNVELRRGALEHLPIDSAAVDAVTMVLVLPHLPSPIEALQEAARVLRPGGRLLIIDMTPHDREEYRRQMGHVWLGFSEEAIRKMLGQAGFTNVNIHALPPATEAKGPALFAASATKSQKLEARS
jgi:ArsR family transcriptional regulator